MSTDNYDPNHEGAEEPVSQVEPLLAELHVSRSDNKGEDFTLRLTRDSIELVPTDDTANHLRQELEAGSIDLETAPSVLRSVAGRGLEGVFSPRPIGESDIKLEGQDLRVKVGPFDTTYGPGEFDLQEAARFAAQYQAVKNRRT